MRVVRVACGAVWCIQHSGNRTVLPCMCHRLKIAHCAVLHVSCLCARLLASVYLQEDYFDLVDVDSFGSDTSYLAGAIDALKYGGMLYLTSTDGMSAGGELLLVAICRPGLEQPALLPGAVDGFLLFCCNAVAPGNPCMAAVCDACWYPTVFCPDLELAQASGRSAPWRLTVPTYAPCRQQTNRGYGC
jgi:hypothetical protein